MTFAAEEIVLPTVRVIDHPWIINEYPLMYRRGVWGAVDYQDGSFGVVHIPTGMSIGAGVRGGSVYNGEDLDTTINAVRALTPWEQHGADAAFGTLPNSPPELFAALNAARRAGRR